MISDRMVEGSPHIFHIQNINKKIGDLINVFLHLLVFIMQAGIVEKPGIIITDKNYAGSRRPHNGPVVGKVFHEFLPEFLGIIPGPAVERHLPATGLVGVVKCIHPEFFEKFYHVHPRFGIDLVNEAGNKKVD